MDKLEKNVDVIYNKMVKTVLESGAKKEDRTGTGTTSIFGYQMRFDLNEGFPILSGKKTSYRLILTELLWFLKGDTNIRFLLENRNNIWNEWGFAKWVRSEDFFIRYPDNDFSDFGRRCLVDEEFNIVYKEAMEEYKHLILTDDSFAKEFGDLGDVYGKLWRAWIGVDGIEIDQIRDVLDQIKNNPDSRRLIVTAWNPTNTDKVALPPCHCFFQFYVADNKLSCQLYQRSVDIFLGLPFNIPSYATIVILFASICDLELGEFIHTSGDAHIYNNHVEQLELQLSREIKPMPKLIIKNIKDISDYTVDDFELVGYNPHPAIKGAVAV